MHSFVKAYNNKIQGMTLKDAVKAVIEQNESLRYHPEIFIFQTKRGEAENIEEIISDLVRSKNSEEEVTNAINKHGNVLNIEDLIAVKECGFDIPEDVVLESKRRVKIYDWYRALKNNK